MSHNQELLKQAMLFKLIYSMAGLFLGLVSMVGGIALFLNGVAGSTSWTAKILGNESIITDAAPGAILFIVGLFIIIVTRYKVRIANKEEDDGIRYIIQSDVHLDRMIKMRDKDNVEEKDTKKNLIFHLLLQITHVIEKVKNIRIPKRTDKHWHDKIDALVEKAVTEKQDYSHSSFSFKTEAEALKFRTYFVSYFNSILDILKKSKRLDNKRLSDSIDKLFKETALNWSLDAPYASYLIRDYILDLKKQLHFFGASIHRIEFCWDWLLKSWREMDLKIAKYDFIDYTMMQRVAKMKIRQRRKA